MANRKLELSPRLSMLAEWVPKGCKFADIGTDHAYLPVWLLLNNVISQAIATDIRTGPLEAAGETARRYQVDSLLELRRCDGLSGLNPDEADTIVIAGMGGETISRILSAAPWVSQTSLTLLLQPMSTQLELRQWLISHRFTILEERLAKEGTALYVALRVRAGTSPAMSQAELWVGRQSHDPLRGQWLDWKMAQVTKALEGHRKAVHPQKEWIFWMEDLLGQIGLMKEEWDSWQL